MTTSLKILSHNAFILSGSYIINMDPIYHAYGGNYCLQKVGDD